MSKIDSLVSDFVVALRKAIAQEAAAAFASVAGGESPVSFGGGGRVAGKKSAPRARAKGAKRTPEAIEAQTKNLLATIKKSPGSSIEQLSDFLKISTKDLALPVLKLWDSKSIKTTGQKRGTKYFPK
ncbi:MAG TPA: hypothetical protein VGI10_19750 [Polyangiaceae bacterium]|jgi:hypothetical protein